MGARSPFSTMLILREILILRPIHQLKEPGPWFNIKMTSYQYRKSHCGGKTILRLSYLHNMISYTIKTTSLYWIRALAIDIHNVSMHVAPCQFYNNFAVTLVTTGQWLKWWVAAGFTPRHHLSKSMITYCQMDHQTLRMKFKWNFVLDQEDSNTDKFSAILSGKQSSIYIVWWLSYF